MSDIELEEKSEIEILREKNLKEREAFLASCMDDPEFAEAFKQLQSAKQNTRTRSSSKAPQKRRRRDVNFRFFGTIPKERRSSARLQKKEPEYTSDDLPDERLIAKRVKTTEDLEKVVYHVNKKAKIMPDSSNSSNIPVEVTEEMIQNVRTGGAREYSKNGDSCHQCRQKSLDTKTICRSGFCVGGRGKFCGICVINRYGEDPVAVLKDPNWECYFCRGCCNCSICRQKAGLKPTGHITSSVKRNAQKLFTTADNVEDFEALLGFEGDNPILEGKGKIQIRSNYNINDFLRFISTY